MSINDVFRALSDPTRRQILRLLHSRDMTAGEIADQFPLARSTLSGHFNVLKQAGLIVTERQGTTIVYSVEGYPGSDCVRRVRPMGLSPFRKRRTNVRFTTATRSDVPVSDSFRARPASTGIPMVSK